VARSLTFDHLNAQTIVGTLTLNGAASNLLSLLSDQTNSQWSFDPQGTRTLSYLSVKDSHNTNASTISTTGLNISNAGNNTGWGFNQTPTVSSLGPTSLVNGSTTADNTPTFTFTTADADSDPVHYIIQISTLANFSSLADVATSTYHAPTSESYTTNTLPDGSYYWRVLVGDGVATSSYSTANSGSVAFVVDATAPTVGALAFTSVTATAITASSTGVSDAGGLAASPYQYRNVTTDTYSGLQATTATFSTLTPNTSYTFSVGVYDAAGNAATSTTGATTTLANPPASLSVVADSATQITVSWNANSNPAGEKRGSLISNGFASPSQ
jgi:hypothetical protein